MSKRLILALAAVAALTIVPALIEGHYVNRWGTPPDLAGASATSRNFPARIWSLDVRSKMETRCTRRSAANWASKDT